MCTLTFLLKKEKQKQMIKDPPCDEPNLLLYTHTKIHYIMYNVEGKYAHQVENNLSAPKLPTHQFVFQIKIHCCTTLFIGKGWTFGFCKSCIVLILKMNVHIFSTMNEVVKKVIACENFWNQGDMQVHFMQDLPTTLFQNPKSIFNY